LKNKKADIEKNATIIQSSLDKTVNKQNEIKGNMNKILYRNAQINAACKKISTESENLGQLISTKKNNI
jgi:hypothetical protein